ncbi:MAG: glycolate oxidase binding subunit [Methylobacteriaceae bacterium]|nr:glycolate oxidase binding subunit [Methylobacteriaceae bacterium]
MIFAPASEAEAADTIAAAHAAKRPLGIEGGGTRAALGRAAQVEATLSTKALAGITLYEPAELVIAAKAGTPLAEIEATLAARGQMLPFEPMDHRALLGTQGEPTIGGITACNISGPRRIQAGACRDHLIGVRFVNGRGDVVKSGGRVMKNVTGLDLVKLNCGAYGTLGLLTEVTYKVLPKPEIAGTLALFGLDDARAIEAMSRALGSPFEVSGAAHLSAGIGGGEKSRTLLRIENFASSVDYRLREIQKLLAPFGDGLRFIEEEADALWCDIRDCRFFAEPRDRAVWRISTAPTRAPSLVARLTSELDLRHFYDWSGGLIWLSVPENDDAGARTIRAALATSGGHATLVRGSPDLRSRIDVFEPLAAPLMKITAGIKVSFDPDAILNPGRMYAGI